MQSSNVGSVTVIAGTGLAAGLVNAIAGGGRLISFPALVAAEPRGDVASDEFDRRCGWGAPAALDRREGVRYPCAVPVAFRGRAARVSKSAASFHDGAQTWRPQRSLVDCSGRNRCDLRWLLRRG